jgi:rfaE bifunctional protein nucleotidyltransferase chain/domain
LAGYSLKEDLFLREVMQYKTPDFEKKIIKPENLANIIKNAIRPLVFTNGCFDILHRGHVTYLAQARSLGASLLVALNTDESVRRQGKGEDRPMNVLANRLAVMASLEVVDYVAWFDTDTPLDLILQIRPDVLVKGGDWDVRSIVGSSEVLAYGGTVHSIPFLYDTSTTKLINKIRKS